MNSRTDLLNYIAKKIKAKYYLEIGVRIPALNFDKIEVKNRFGVDPAVERNDIFNITSDEFFRDLVSGTFDLIFVDGLHEKEQVKNDIINSFNSLSEGGVIVIHDCNPLEKIHTLIPRKQTIWTGDVYKTIVQITSPKFTVDFDYGCCVIRKVDRLTFDSSFVSWETFNEEREVLLNLVSVEKAVEIIDNW
jgi:hypothetical protein